MYCKNCGTKLLDHSKFCGQCGTPQTNEQAAPAPQKVRQNISIYLNDNIGAIIELLLSVLILSTAFMPWVKLGDLFYNFSGNLLDIISLLIGVDGVGFAVLIIAFSIAGLLLHGYAIYCSAAKATEHYNRSWGAALWTIIFSALWMIGILVLKMWAASETSNAFDELNASGIIKYGSGNILCLLISILQLISCNIFSGRNRRTTNGSKKTVVCPHCGTTYEKITAATACPNCHRLPGETQSPAKKSGISQKPDTIICPFCKRIYPKGTLYCDDCHAQIGAVNTTKPSSTKHPRFCPQCGTKLGVDSLYCFQCGTKV